MGGAPVYPGDQGTSGTGAILKLQPHGATPPTEAYVTNGAGLLIQCQTDLPGVIVTVSAQILLPDGTISVNAWPLSVPATRARTSLNVSLPEGFLLSMTAFASVVTGSPNRVYIAVRLVTSAITGPNILAMMQGYVNAGVILTWPNSTLVNFTDGPGALISVTGTTPGVGAEISETVPTNAIWRLKTFAFKLTTAVGGSNRQPQILIDDGTNVLVTSVAPTTLTPGQFCTYQTGDDAFVVAQTNAVQWLQMVANIRLMPGYRIRTSTVNLGASDQYTAPQYQVEEYMIQ